MLLKHSNCAILSSGVLNGKTFTCLSFHWSLCPYVKTLNHEARRINTAEGAPLEALIICLAEGSEQLAVINTSW